MLEVVILKQNFVKTDWLRSPYSAIDMSFMHGLIIPKLIISLSTVYNQSWTLADVGLVIIIHKDTCVCTVA